MISSIHHFFFFFSKLGVKKLTTVTTAAATPATAITCESWLLSASIRVFSWTSSVYLSGVSGCAAIRRNFSWEFVFPPNQNPRRATLEEWDMLSLSVFTSLLTGYRTIRRPDENDRDVMMRSCISLHLRLPSNSERCKRQPEFELSCHHWFTRTAACCVTHCTSRLAPIKPVAARFMPSHNLTSACQQSLFHASGPWSNRGWTCPA